ncbi:unnamed protein product [Heterobilharzia americana]|nr:unnamed protein product [Heterobilharzia americana]CAH8512897.1 unnamed protein product [Heterobilharzia americana]
MFWFMIFLCSLNTILTSSSTDGYITYDNQSNIKPVTQLEDVLHSLISYQGPSNPSCFGCKFLVWSAKTFIFDSKYYVHEHIEVTCKNLKNLYTPCKRILTEFLDFAYDLIYNYSSADLCAIAGICSNPPKINFCPVCLLGVAEGKNILLSDALVTEIQSVLVHACDNLKLEVQCTQFLDKFYQEATDVVKHILEPHFVCETVQLCNATHVDGMNYADFI